MSFFGDVVSGIGNALGIASSDKWAGKNLDLQRDAAQKGIQWRVKDAKAAGVHPLYALGNPGISIAPVHNDSAAYMSAMGQDISRAVTAGLSARERRQEAATAAMRSSVEFDQETQRRELENQLLRSQIAKLDASQVPPPPPEAVAGPPVAVPGSTRPQPSSFTVGSPGEPARAPGAITDYQYHRQADGGIGLTMSDDMKQRSEDNFFDELGWQWRNRVVPFWQGRRPVPRPNPRDYPAPRGYRYEWDAHRQAFYPRHIITGTWYGSPTVIYGPGGSSIRR